VLQAAPLNAMQLCMLVAIALPHKLVAVGN
jgi:hypothetical protein